MNLLITIIAEPMPNESLLQLAKGLLGTQSVQVLHRSGNSISTEYQLEATVENVSLEWIAGVIASKPPVFLYINLEERA